jgi:hypothetical protein
VLNKSDSNKAIKKLFRRFPIADLDTLFKTVKTSSRMSIFRRLREIGYFSSYTHTGRYYTLADIPQFDDYGLWIHQGIGFSQFGTLRATIVQLVNNGHRTYVWVPPICCGESIILAFGSKSLKMRSSAHPYRASFAVLRRTAPPGPSFLGTCCGSLRSLWLGRRFGLDLRSYFVPVEAFHNMLYPPTQMCDAAFFNSKAAPNLVYLTLITC